MLFMLPGCRHEQATPADFLRDSPASAVVHDLPPQVCAFIAQQETNAITLAGKLGVKSDSTTLNYFRLARKGEYRAASRIYQDLRERGGKVDSPKYDPNLRLPLWDPLLEVQLTLDAYAAGAGKYATRFGQSIVQSIAPGSIYFGGTDPGRGLVAAFCRSSFHGDPFFVLTQNQLADGQHLDYLRAAFGDKINVLSSDDAQRAFQSYMDDAQRRYEHDQAHPNDPPQVRPGEDVRMENGRPHVSGQVAVMVINGLLVKTIFDKNPNREFYIEESFPLDWMYPHLTPHGPIMKINRQPLPELTPDILAKDREFWQRWQTEFIGGWLSSNTPVSEVCAFVERIFLHKDYVNFQGDTNFVANYYATAAYAKLRSSQAGLYTWRIANAKSSAEQQRMIHEADFAFRQSFAMCPTSPEAVFRYVNLLISLQRREDALLLARTAVRLKPSDTQFARLVGELERLKGTPAQKPGS